MQMNLSSEFYDLIFFLKKFCCMAIRNIVSRNKKLGEKLIANNVEEPLRKIYQQNDRNCSEESKAALRDLDLQIDLKELWTGSGRQ
jgi:armadillo repeat-containing protein 6